MEDNTVITLINGVVIYIDKVLEEKEDLVKIDPKKCFQIRFQQAPDGRTNIGLLPLDGAPWSPESVYINKRQIMYFETVSETSQFKKALVKQQIGIEVVPGNANLKVLKE